MKDLLYIIGGPILAYRISLAWYNNTDTLSWDKPVLYKVGNNVIDIITLFLAFVPLLFIMQLAEWIMGAYFTLFKFSSFMPMDLSSVLEMAADSAFPKSYSIFSILKNFLFSTFIMGLW